MVLNFLFKNERLIGARSSTNNIGAGVGGVVAGVGSVVNGIMGAFSQSAANSSNAALTRKQMEWQAHQNELDRQWNSFEAEISRANQRKMQQSQFEHEQDMWNRNNQYNSPAAQMARYQMAGINPFVAMSGNQPAIASSSEVPSVPSAPQASGMAGRGAASPIPMQPVNPVNGILQGVSTFANVLDTLASAKKKGVETTQLENTMTDMMRKLAADADSSEYIAIINQANASVAKDKAQKEMQELTEKIKLLREQVFNANEEGNLITQKALRETEERYLAIAKKNLALGEYNLVQKNIEAFDKRLEVELKEAHSRIANNYASANEHNAGASLKIAQKKTEDLTRDDKAAILSYDRTLKSIIHEYKIDPKTGKFTTDNKKGLSIALYSALNEAYRLGYITEEEAGSTAFQGLDQALKVLGGISESIGKLAGSLK